MKVQGILLALCLALTPEPLRAVREEQWKADLRDGPAMGISPSSLLFGAVCSSATARFYESKRRGSVLLSRFTRGKNMKLVVGMMAAAVVLAGGVVVSVEASTHGQAEASVFKGPVGDRPVGGYEGWWNATPLNGSAEGLPQETVAVNTATGKIVDAFNRSMNDAGLVTLVSDVDFEVVPDPAWPRNSVVIIETATGKVIEDFRVDGKGAPIIAYTAP